VSDSDSNTRSATPGDKRGKFPWFAILRLFGVALFVFVLLRTDLGALSNSLREVRPMWLLAAVLSQCTVLLLKGVRWHVLTGGTPARTSFGCSLGQCLESYAIGVITPGRLGEFMRVGHAVGKGAPLSAGILVLCERLLDTGLFMAGFGAAVLAGFVFPGQLELGGLAAGLGAVILFVASAMLSSERMSRLARNLMAATPFRRFASFQIHSPERVGRTLAVLLLSVAGALMYFLSCQLLAVSVGLPSPFLKTVGSIAGAGLLTILPITILGMGTREVTLLYLYSASPRAVVLAFSTLVLLVAQAGGGIIALAAGHAVFWLSGRKRPGSGKQNPLSVCKSQP